MERSPDRAQRDSVPLSAPMFRGVTCPTATAPARPSTSGIAAGRRTAPETGSCRRSQADADLAGRIDWGMVGVDSASFRAHQAGGPAGAAIGAPDRLPLRPLPRPDTATGRMPGAARPGRPPASYARLKLSPPARVHGVVDSGTLLARVHRDGVTGVGCLAVRGGRHDGCREQDRGGRQAEPEASAGTSAGHGSSDSWRRTAPVRVDEGVVARRKGQPAGHAPPSKGATRLPTDCER